jgi:YHS domain-containing protein
MRRCRSHRIRDSVDTSGALDRTRRARSGRLARKEYSSRIRPPSIDRPMPSARFSLMPRLLALFALGLLLAGCATRNTISDGADSRLMLRGYDPVSYFTQPKPIPGRAELKVDYDGATYRFATPENLEIFKRAPEKYAPNYGGFCSNGAVYGVMLGGEHDLYKIVDGRLFMFGDPSSRDYWEMNQAKNIELGDYYWRTEMKDTWSAKYQAYKRIIFKVPHYKTGKQLAEEYAAFKAKQGG